MSLMWEDVGSDRGIHTLFLQTGSGLNLGMRIGIRYDGRGMWLFNVIQLSLLQKYIFIRCVCMSGGCALSSRLVGWLSLI